MFRRSKGEGGEGEKSARGETAGEIGAPPLKPFSKKGTHVPASAPAAGGLRPDIPRHLAEVPAPRRAERTRAGQGEGNKLTVGRDIHLKGEITACDKLVVEGRVEACLSDARVIEVAPSGHFKGNAQVDEADISGRYEGELVAREKLTVRASGRISGSIRYGRIVIESGGEISGDMQTLGQAGRAPAPKGGGDAGAPASDDEAGPPGGRP